MTRRGSAAGSRAAVAAVLAVLFLAAAPAAAQELLLLSEAPKIRAITIEGNSHFSDGTIKKHMVSRRPPWWLRPFRTPRLFRGQLDQDVQSVLGLYRSNGYLRAQVTSEAVPVKDGVEVKVRIEEGSPIRVVDTDIRGVGEKSRASLLHSLRHQPGKPLSPYHIDQDRLRVEGYLADRGRPYGVVEDNVQFWKDEAFVALLVDEGPLVTIGNVKLSGAAGVDSAGLAREFTVHQGDRFSREELTRTRQRLYDTGFFNDVTPRFPDQPDTVVDVTFELRKRKQNWFSAGIGYSNLNESFIRLSEEWGTRNILGTGRRFTISARSSHAFPRRPNATPPRNLFELGDGSADATLYEPWLLGTRIRGRLTGYYRYDNVTFRDIRQHSYGSTAEISRELKERRTNVAFQVEARWTRNEFLESDLPEDECERNPILCKERYQTRLASLRFSYDDRDNFLNPTRGSRHDLVTQVAGGILGGDNNFQKNVAASSVYIGGPTGAVFSTRVRVGVINPPGEVLGGEAVDAIPREDRFLTGGASTVRGYQENTLNGLRDGRALNGGGLTEFLMNAELRFPIRGSLGGVLFLDAGNVWRDFDRVHPRHFIPTFSASRTQVEHLRYSIGGGLRVNTPVGPIRLETAIRLSPLAADSTGTLRDVHFALGQTF